MPNLTKTTKVLNIRYIHIQSSAFYQREIGLEVQTKEVHELREAPSLTFALLVLPQHNHSQKQLKCWNMGTIRG